MLAFKFEMKKNRNSIKIIAKIIKKKLMTESVSSSSPPKSGNNALLELYPKPKPMPKIKNVTIFAILSSKNIHKMLISKKTSVTESMKILNWSSTSA